MYYVLKGSPVAHEIHLEPDHFSLEQRPRPCHCRGVGAAWDPRRLSKTHVSLSPKVSKARRLGRRLAFTFCGALRPRSPTRPASRAIRPCRHPSGARRCTLAPCAPDSMAFHAPPWPRRTGSPGSGDHRSAIGIDLARARVWRPWRRRSRPSLDRPSLDHPGPWPPVGPKPIVRGVRVVVPPVAPKPAGGCPGPGEDRRSPGHPVGPSASPRIRHARLAPVLDGRPLSGPEPWPVVPAGSRFGGYPCAASEPPSAPQSSAGRFGRSACRAPGRAPGACQA